MLRATGVTKAFGGLVAVDDVSFEIDDEEVVGLIGPNGAGKTTLFNAITGVYPPTEGEIYLNGTEITGMKPHEISRTGVARTFQTARTFNESTVLENVVVGGIFGNGDSRSAAEERARQNLAFVGLDDAIDEEVGALNLADRKLLELARALTTEPEFVLVDEIGSGLTPAELETLTDTLLRIRSERGISVFWIEHIMDAIMGSTDRIIVLNQGEKIADGTPEEVQQNQQVEEAYLGGVEV
ncbi:ABC transporter ATP-binding protein [Natrarchaeobaculum aegyptiacum]|uniref:ABC transporter ATP-binding protein n=1 Tax=Natrarchaeobaculum aegyptiacum TaxID=745377 RepID=A0A2Z2HUZ1_9EURY|nr:ABC transporter ATP-binding protein [Natrarchaeobaculum aegyptiacum]ARS91089.1 ABC transporter ATP-binding protein [Natrarchaeobaculum aegyptiacum]